MSYNTVFPECQCMYDGFPQSLENCLRSGDTYAPVLAIWVGLSVNVNTHACQNWWSLLQHIHTIVPPLSVRLTIELECKILRITEKLSHIHGSVCEDIIALVWSCIVLYQSCAILFWFWQHLHCYFQSKSRKYDWVDDLVSTISGM